MSSLPSIEQAILRHGRRGMDRLARHLPPAYAERAARALLAAERVIVTTGFFVDGKPETDGPPGAFFLGRALARCGARVAFVCEAEHLDLLRALSKDLWNVSPLDSAMPAPPGFIEFPVMGEEESGELAKEIVADERPGAIVSVERCGRTATGAYWNMRGQDISACTAQLDEIVLAGALRGVVSVGVGDGGNELGMGSVAERMSEEFGTSTPVATSVDHLVVAAVSNWGAYGIIAHIARERGADLLPTRDEESAALSTLCALGAIDGMTGANTASVDGFSLEIDLGVLRELRELAQQGRV